MWTKISRVLKQSFPPAHKHLRRLSSSTFQHGVGFCLPRRIAGHLVWTHPRLLTAEAPEPHILKWISELLSSGATFFDVGAHYGWIAMAAAYRVGDSGRVVAFEASPVLLDVLNQHKRVNRLRQIEIVAKAVSNADADAVPFFLVNRGLSFRNSLTIGADDTPHIAVAEKTRHEVGSVTLDRFVLDSGIVPGVIKIDVEGAELLVLQGAERLLARYRPYLILGVHSYWLPRSQTVGQIFEFLSRYGYQIEDEHAVQFEGGYVADYLCGQRRTSL
jgi:FkbM family methyltransferase